MESVGFATCLFSKGNRNGPLIAFEERKTDERIERNSTFLIPVRGLSFNWRSGARLIQQ